MPTPSKGPRLYLLKRKGRPSVYVIRDTGRPERSTRTSDLREAEKQLAAYIADKERPAFGAAPSTDPAQYLIADALAIYADEHAPTTRDPQRIAHAIEALLPFWGALPLTAIKAETCRRYAKSRKVPIYGPPLEPGQGRRIVGYRPAAQGTVRKELGTLQAALNYCASEGYILAAPSVKLPEKPATTQRALTRAEAARLIRAARSIDAHHVARFILVCLYTGTRSAATLELRLDGPSVRGGWIDLERGVLYRRGSGERDTAKRRTPAPVPRQLLAHARRWRAKGQTYAVEWRGLRVGSIKTAWRSTVTAAKLGWKPTRHTLKHTAISWAMENGLRIEDAAQYFGTSAETIRSTYWHLSPHYLAEAVALIENRKRPDKRA